MSCIYKNKGSGRHCSKEGKEGQFCPGSGAFLKCYTPSDPLHDVDFSKLQIVNIDNYEEDVDKLKELLEKNPGRVGIISVDSLPDVEVIERPPYCKFCFNARVYQPTEDDLLTGNTLDDTNDSSSIVVGEHMRPYRSIMINSGNGEPLNIEFLEWAVTRDRWETVGKYYPKFCPECGRRLDEYDEDKM